MNILVTGGASGLGKEIVEALAKIGNNNILFTYSNSFSESQDLEGKYDNVNAVKCDFRVIEEVESLCDRLVEFKIEGLINNAFSGSFLTKHFNKIDSEMFVDDFHTNIIPVLKITQASIAIFRKNKFGRILTILSAALIGNPPVGSSIYVANKAYLEKLSKVWAHENIRFNITSNTISPSFMQTNLTSSFDERIIEQMVNSYPLKSLLTPKEVAGFLINLMDSSSHLNGVDFPLNAGSNLR